MGSGEPASIHTKILEKESKQREFANELQKQIEERDFLRKKEEYGRTRA